MSVSVQWYSTTSQLHCRAYVLCAAVISTCMCGFAEASTAETSESNKSDSQKPLIAEVIVTSQKRSENLQDVPMSITVKSGEELAEAGIKSLQDLSFVVPGLSVGEQGPGKQQIAIRGVSNYVGQFSLTGTYLDEMPVTPMNSASGGEASNGADVSPLDLERVEVLKGPQGTLFGEGAAGGVIRFITKDPDLTRLGGEFSGTLYSTEDGGESQEASVIVNLPVVEDVFGIRIVGAYEDQSGWIDQPAGLPAPSGFLDGDPSQPVVIGLPSAGRKDINDGTAKHVRVKALFTPMPQLQIRALAQIDRYEGGALNAVNMLPYEDGNYRQGVDLNAPSFYEVDGNLYNLTATYDLGFAELLSSTSYVDRDLLQAYGWASPEPEPDLQVYQHGFVQKYKTFNQEVRFTSAGEGPLHWTLGGVYKDAHRINSFGPAGWDLMLGGGVYLDLGTEEYNEFQSKSWAGFADASYELTDRFEIGGGLRYFSDEQQDADRNLTTGELIEPPSLGTAEKLTWRVVAKYKLSEDVNLYGSVGTGFRSAGLFNSANAVARGFPKNVDPEVITSYELGAKMALLDRRLSLNVAAFYSDYDGLQSLTFVACPSCSQGVISVKSNGQFAVIKGIEADLVWAATDNFTLSFAGQRIDAEITKLAANVTSSKFHVGDPLDMIPEYSVSATADYRFQWNNLIPGSFLLSLSRVGKSFYTDHGTDFVLEESRVTSAPEKTLLNARLGGEWHGWELNLFGRNLTNERKIVTPYGVGAGIFPPQMRPRTFGVEFSKAFW